MIREYRNAWTDIPPNATLSTKNHKLLNIYRNEKHMEQTLRTEMDTFDYRQYNVHLPIDAIHKGSERNKILRLYVRFLGR
jgi:hypothetical protein